MYQLTAKAEAALEAADADRWSLTAKAEAHLARTAEQVARTAVKHWTNGGRNRFLDENGETYQVEGRPHSEALRPSKP
jgi:hypothetical protein